MPRSPIGPKAMTPAQRKREQRTRDKTAIMESPSSECTERQCLMVMQGAYGDDLQAAAWQQLGKLKGWLA